MARRSIIMLGCLGAIAAPAVAQDDPRPSGDPTVESYLCTFAGKCGGETNAPTLSRDAPATKGFRLARPAGERADSGALPSASRPSSFTSGARQHFVRHNATAPRDRLPTAYGAVAPAYTATPTAAATGANGPRANLFIGFKRNSAVLTAQGLNSAQVFARALMMPELRAKKFLIEGHADARGSSITNQSLSGARAAAVTNYLASLGVDRKRLQSRGFGASEPLPGRAPADPANRRVEASLLP